MTSRVIPSLYLRAHLQNGSANVYLTQMHRLTFKFCKENPVGRGVREYLEENLQKLGELNKQSVFYLLPTRHCSPKLIAEYLNGETYTLDVCKHSRDEVGQMVEFCLTRSGQPIHRLRRKHMTSHPSTQGIWTPFTNRHPKQSTLNRFFPDRSYHIPKNLPKTATEQILELSRKIK
ncbi:hypothetical protein SNEBB_005249 [Seison nebaliae]|nr:hypothetical protein SNEBB_005249 [Seison nebaliae]